MPSKGLGFRVFVFMGLPSFTIETVTVNVGQLHTFWW